MYLAADMLCDGENLERGVPIRSGGYRDRVRFYWISKGKVRSVSAAHFRSSNIPSTAAVPESAREPALRLFRHFSHLDEILCFPAFFFWSFSSSHDVVHRVYSDTNTLSTGTEIYVVGYI